MDLQEVLFKFFGGLAVFLYGMNLMSDGLRKIGSESFKKFLQTLTKHRFTAVFVGLIITCAIQSSSATSVMVVGFINAGLLAFEQGVAVVLGADIGTTITAWIVSALGIGKLKLASYALPVIAVGFIINFTAKSRKKKMIGQALLGLGLLFLGLGTMSDGIGPIKKSTLVREVFAACGRNPFLGVLAGTITTMIIQSSSATIAIVQVMASQGIFDLNTALPLMLGDNIGTTITAQLAAIGGTKGARGLAMANSLFKIFGTALFLPLLLLGVYQDGIRFVVADGAVGPSGLNSTIMVQIAVAHTAFNIINTAIFSTLLWPILIKTAKKVSFGKGSFESEKKDLRYLDPLLLANPPMAIEQCIHELGYMTKRARKNIVASFNAFIEGNLGEAGEIEHREETIDRLQTQVTAFLVELSRQDLSENVSHAIPRLILCINDAERIGDQAENLMELAELKVNNNLQLTDGALSELKNYFDLIDRQFIAVQRAIDLRENPAVDEALALEQEINQAHETLTQNVIVRLEEQQSKVLNGIVFFDVIAKLERIGDHLTNIAERVDLNCTD